jgi:hypothetical protein
MDTTRRQLILGKVLWISLWILVIADIIYEKIWNNLITPLGIMVLLILIVGTLLSRWRNQPILSTEGWLPRTIFAALLLVLTAGYLIVRIFILK